MDEKNAAKIEDQLKALRDKYAKQLPEKISQLETLFAKIASGDQNTDALKQLHGAAHKLAGSGSTFGFDMISRAARELEAFLKSLLETKDSISENHVFRMESLLGAVKQSALFPDDVIPDQEQQSGIPEPDTVVAESRLIFVVDDDSDIAADIALQLESFGYEVKTFDDAKKVQKALTEAEPAMVLMDIMYPEDPLAGTRIMEIIQSARAVPVPVIFMSGRDDAQARLGAIRGGGRAYFTKPLHVSEMIDTLEEIIKPAPVHPYRILIVEDSVLLAEHFALILKNAGMETKIITQPLNALDALIEFKPELVLMDIYMPECSGLELAAIIRQQETFISVPIVFLSAEKNINKQFEVLHLGGDDFLSKPIQPAHLISSVSARAQRHRALRSLMVRDSLTGLLNHTALLDQLDTEISRAKRKNAPLAFAMIDIDHFKSVNDTYGHPTGDRVLKSLSRLLKNRLRKTDIVGRYGGEEFALILPDTNQDDAANVLNGLRDGFSRVRHFFSGKEFSVTFSCGLSAYPDFPEAQELVDAADKALYNAKHEGRNRVVFSEP